MVQVFFTSCTRNVNWNVNFCVLVGDEGCAPT